MDCKENKSIVCAFWSAIAANDENKLREVLAPDLQVYNPVGSEPQNRDTHIQTSLQWNRAFSASRFEIEAQICEGNMVVTRGVMRASHSKGAFLGVPPTGIKIAVPGITIARIRDGRIVERHVCSDRLGMMRQLGILPSPQAGGPGTAAGRVGQADAPISQESRKSDYFKQKENSAMMSEQYKAVSRRYFSACQFNDHSALKEVLSSELLAHHRGLPGPLSRDELLQTIDAFAKAFSEQQYTIEDQVAEGNTVATRVTWRATHSGPFQGVPATGRRIAVGGIAISRIENGRIVERWLSMDQMEMLKQLGLVP